MEFCNFELVKNEDNKNYTVRDGDTVVGYMVYSSDNNAYRWLTAWYSKPREWAPSEQDYITETMSSLNSSISTDTNIEE